MKAIVPLLAVAGLALAGLAFGADGIRKPIELAPAPPRAASASGSRCEGCHAPTGWTTAAFPHDRTGFPLTGKHGRVPCQACHVRGTRTPLSQGCSSCHRDAHAGEFGQRCEGCHNSDGWESEFTADAHQRTNFPLLGRHAVIPCQECHLEKRGPSFRLSTVDCVGCHQRDYDRTSSLTVSHTAAGFGTACRECHEVSSFRGARFRAHDACFQLGGTEHAGIPCQGCHTSLAGLAITGACASHTAACTTCHSHACERTDAQHREVPGYQCKDQKCYECHRFSSRP